MSVGIVAMRLFLAALLGGLVGLDRETKKRAAGLRTHVLVSLGSALVMITSAYIFEQYRGLTNMDPARLGAQVISGIGFLGAGTIIKQGTTVKGLTTAASLWAVACIGLAAGIGFYTAAILAGIVVFMTLVLLSKFEKVFRRKSSDELDISMRLQNTPGKLGEMVSAIGKLGMQINNVSIEYEEEDYLTVQLTLSLSKNDDAEDILAIVKEIPGVHMVSYSPWNMRTS